MDKRIRYLDLFDAYPVVKKGRIPQLPLERAKMVISAYLMQQTHDVPAMMFLHKMCFVRGLTPSALPDIQEACELTGYDITNLENPEYISNMYNSNRVMEILPNFLMDIR